MAAARSDDARLQLTGLLEDWRHGRAEAFDEIFTLVYDELRSLASSYMRRERPDHTLQTTALVNEAYLKLLGQRDALPQNRLHFFAAAARVMRHVLVDHARARGAGKRGGDVQRVPMQDAVLMAEDRATELVALDDALRQLAELDARKGQVVELRFFGGLTIEETAEFLGVSFNTVVRDWEMARAWLFRTMYGEGDER